MKRISGFGSALFKNNTVVGFMLGLIVGMCIAIIIALVISRTPVPFSSKVHQPEGASDRVVKPAADPNQPMLPNRDGSIDVFKEPEPVEEATPDAPIGSMSHIFLQTGAFRNRADAEGMVARLALVGVEAKITEGSNEQGILYRVRLGPIDQPDLPRVQDHLRANGFEFATAAAD